MSKKNFFRAVCIVAAVAALSFSFLFRNSYSQIAIIISNFLMGMGMYAMLLSSKRKKKRQGSFAESRRRAWKDTVQKYLLEKDL
ncbi:MAG: hypothetical protein ACI9S8_001948 [Chlamydiales bacterium]|jgi:hypothetical protein